MKRSEDLARNYYRNEIHFIYLFSLTIIINMCKFFYISTCRYVICVIYNMCNIGASVCILLYSIVNAKISIIFHFSFRYLSTFWTTGPWNILSHWENLKILYLKDFSVLHRTINWRKKTVNLNAVLFSCETIKTDYISGNCFRLYKNNNLFNILF